jgi:hypothetical protein
MVDVAIVGAAGYSGVELTRLVAGHPEMELAMVTSASDARIASGIAGTGAEKLSGCGEFLLIASGQTIRFQSAWLSPGDLAPACAVAVAQAKVS